MKRTFLPLLLVLLLLLAFPVSAELLDSGESQIELTCEEESLVSAPVETEEAVYFAGADAVVSEPKFEKPVITGLYNSKNGGDLRWKAVPGADRYAIYHTNAGKRVKIATTTNTTYMDTSIKDNCWGKVYAYSVAPMKNGKTYDRGESQTLQRLAPMKITTLTGNTTDGIVNAQFAISTGENKAHGYEVQYAKSSADLFARSGSYAALTLNGRKSTAAAFHLEAGQTYFFRVRAYVNYTHSVTKKVTKTWSQYSDVKSITLSKPEPTMCWIPATGDCYHEVPNCGRMNPNKATRITIEEAKRRGYTKCPKCW